MWQGTKGGHYPIASKELRPSVQETERINPVKNHMNELGTFEHSIETVASTPTFFAVL